MRAFGFPFPGKSPRRDAWLLLLSGAAWLPVEWWRPVPGIAIGLGCVLTLALCKILRMPPVWRAFVAPLPVVATLPWLGADGRPGLSGALAAAGGYLAFTLARRVVYAVRSWRFHAPDGRTDGWDYARWVIARERFLARSWPRRPLRILFPPTTMEADLRRGFRHRAELLRFAEPTAETLRECDLVVPLSLKDLARLRESGLLPERNPLPLPSAECVDLCNDKLAFNRAMVAAGFADCVPEVADALPFPYVLKKRIDAWGDNTHVVASAEDERRLGALLHDANYFRQAFAPGRREYAAHLLVIGGRIAAALTVEYGFTHDLHKKSREHPPHYRRLRRSTHLPLFRDMLAAIGYEGLCCVNYKLDGGRVRLLEVNPRFGASLAPWFFVMLRALPRAKPLRANATTSSANPTGA
ncbi:MAG: hypothetical protein QM719_05985 [Thermomonas sp.]